MPIDNLIVVVGENPVLFTPTIWNPAKTFKYTLVGGAITADRQLNLPVITGTDTLAVLTLAQTLANKTLTSPAITTSPTAVGATWTDLGAVTTADINGGTVDGVTIGATAAPSVIRGQDDAFRVENPAATYIYTLTGGAIAADRILNLPVITATDTLAVLALAQTFLTGVKTFNSSILAIRNPADTFSYTLAGAAILADRTLTLPLTTGADTLAALGVAQTWTALQSFGTNLGGTLQTAAQANVTSLGTLTGLTMGGNINLAGNWTNNHGVISNAGGTSITIRAGAVAVGSGVYLLMNRADTNGGQFIVYTPVVADTSETARLTIAGGAATVAVTWQGAYHTGARFGAATIATGSFTVEGVTSGVVTMTVAAVAGTWTMTLPTAVPGTNGDQLSALTTGVCSWTAAGSLREFKNILGVLDPRTALMRVLMAPVELWTYKRDAKSSTGDFDTIYAGVVADKAPWAMHHEGRIFDPTSAFGHAAAAIQALHSDLQDALAEIADLKLQLAALQA